MILRLTILILAITVGIEKIYPAEYLFHNGKSDYVISLSLMSSAEEQVAAQELQYYIEKISGVRLQVVKETSPRGKSIKILADNTDEEGFVCSSDGAQITIRGFGKRGVLYGVYDFLETEFGVHWLASKHTAIPRKSSYQLASFSRECRPAFESRLNYYYEALHDDSWCLHNRVNTTKHIQNHIDQTSWWGMHTLKDLIPESRYFAVHPEYFCLRNGKRQRGGQLCLSNPDVVALAIKGIKEIIRANPSYRIYDVSQNDNRLFCQCKKCVEIAEKYGGLSGLNIWFVNQVARSVYLSFPDKLIGTFAYRETRAVPTGIKPEKNVAIRLCAFETCIIHGLSECSRNNDFKEELEKWKGITSNLYVWDYCVGFKQYLAPCPDFRAMASRLRAYSRYGVKGVLMEGNYEGVWGEFSELRQWVAAKLLWNLHQDVDSLARVFIYSYYGASASKIMEYYLLAQKRVTQSTHFVIYADYKNPVYSNPFIQSGRKLLDEALRLAGNDNALKKKVQRVASQIYYLEMARSYRNSVRDGTFSLLTKILDSDPTYLMEYHKDLAETLKSLNLK